MSYKKIITECVSLIEDSNFWKEGEPFRFAEGELSFSADNWRKRGDEERELIERLDKVDKNASKITLGLFYVVRDEDPDCITEKTIDQKIKGVPVCQESSPICWNQLLGKIACIETLQKGLARLKDSDH
jgi:hypothetical protein